MKAIFSVSSKGFHGFNSDGDMEYPDIFGVVTNPPGFLFERLSDNHWRSQIGEDHPGDIAIDAIVTKETPLPTDPITYQLEIGGLRYVPIDGLDAEDVGKIEIPTIIVEGRSPMQISDAVVEYINKNGMTVNGSDNVDLFYIDGLAELDAEVSWNLGAGDDGLNTGNAGADEVDGGDGADHIETLDGDDIIRGGEGADKIWSGEGNDKVYAGGGNDGEGQAHGVELGEGDDYFYGEAGDDAVFGWGGNDYLDGGTGIDILQGYVGDDTYVVDRQEDIVYEWETVGDKDRVMARNSYSLSSGPDHEIEVLTTTSSAGTAQIDLTGNEFAQEIVGNSGDNVLHTGGGVADHLRGLSGNDTYRVFNAGDTIVESAAQGSADRVMAAVDYKLGAGVHVELMTTNGSTGTSGIDLTGNEVAQSIVGNAGSNILDGKDGNDTLKGLGGKDFFVFSTALGTANVDIIADFNAADDTIRLENAIFTVLTTGALVSSAFKDIADGPKDADDRVIYNSATGHLYYDADGSGGAFGNVKFASIANLADLTSTDFVVI